MGLVKKVAIADPLAQFVWPLFQKAETGPLEFIQAWAAGLGYTAQLYFDFSGYSDMAIGLGLMFGIALPLNFFSPYKAASIIEFWRRWHMTLSSFLRDYLYIPLGGGRVSPTRRQVNLMIVMLLGGLWHGAAWTFVFWGALHGLYLVVNHGWRRLASTRPVLNGRIATLAYGGLTFLCVVVGWVFFRASSFRSALHILHGMVHPSSMSLPGELIQQLGLIDRVGLSENAGMSYADFVGFWSMLAFAYALAWLTPNTAQWFGIAQREAVRPGGLQARRAAWLKPCVVATLFWIAGFGLFGSVPSEFLYFQF